MSDEAAKELASAILELAKALTLIAQQQSVQSQLNAATLNQPSQLPASWFR